MREWCDLCSAGIGPRHRHLLDSASRHLICVCEGCALLFPREGRTKYTLVPRRVCKLDGFTISDGQWNSLGIPIGLYLANRWNWHVSFGAIVVLVILVILSVLLLMRPVNEHLKLKQDKNAFAHLIATVSEPSYTLAFGVTTLLATGGFMLMPFGSAFTVHNLGIDIEHLPTIYLVSGLFSIFTGPLVGRLSDSIGKFPTFMFGTAMSVIMVLIYTHLGQVSLTVAITVNVLMFVGIFSRMIPSQALISAIPDASQRGSFSAISASLQQLSGGLGSVLAAWIIAENADGTLRYFDRLGYVVVSTSILSLIAMYFVQRQVARKAGQAVV